MDDGLTSEAAEEERIAGISVGSPEEEAVLSKQPARVQLLGESTLTKVEQQKHPLSCSQTETCEVGGVKHLHMPNWLKQPARSMNPATPALDFG